MAFPLVKHVEHFVQRASATSRQLVTVGTAQTDEPLRDSDERRAPDNRPFATLDFAVSDVTVHER